MPNHGGQVSIFQSTPRDAPVLLTAVELVVGTRPHHSFQELFWLSAFLYVSDRHCEL